MWDRPILSDPDEIFLAVAPGHSTSEEAARLVDKRMRLVNSHRLLSGQGMLTAAEVAEMAAQDYASQKMPAMVRWWAEVALYLAETESLPLPRRLVSMYHCLSGVADVYRRDGIRRLPTVAANAAPQNG